VPTTHDPNQAWPLVVTCHGTYPFDRDDRQVREWRYAAETHGFILAAPRLRGTNAILTPLLEDQIAVQYKDEKAILRIVNDLVATYNVDPQRVLLTGWSAGGYAVFFTGLRNPNVFRAVAGRMPNFERRFVDLPAVTDRIDTRQNVYIFYGARDLVRNESQAAAAWLREQGWDDASLREQELESSHDSRPDLALQFFRSACRRPHVAIRTDLVDRRDGMRVRFSYESWPQAVEQFWDFGDGARSAETIPIHVYEKAGMYQFRLLLKTKDGKFLVRERKLRAPLGPLS
jgi:predicted esterase